MFVSLSSNKPLEIQQLAHALFLRQPVTICQVFSILGKTTFCANGHSQLNQLCCVIQRNILNVSISLSQLFLSFSPFSYSAVSASDVVSISTESCPFVISSSRCYFIFRVLGLPYPVVITGLILCTTCILVCSNSQLLHPCCVKLPGKVVP